MTRTNQLDKLLRFFKKHCRKNITPWNEKAHSFLVLSFVSWENSIFHTLSQILQQRKTKTKYK